MSDTTALAPVDADALPAPIFGGEQMVEALTRYRELQRALDASMPDQIMQVDGKLFRKKGYWRAVALAFQLDVETIDEVETARGVFEDGRPNFGYRVTCRATAKSGRTVTGDGACHAIEKAPRDPEVRWRALPHQASDHNIRSHATTRAFNRAVSNLVGFGEVSAEEIERDDRDDRPPQVELPPRLPSTGPRRASAGPSAPPISDAQRKRLWAIGKGAGWADDDIRAHVKRYGFDHSDAITRDVYEQICAELERGPDGTRGGDR